MGKVRTRKIKVLAKRVMEEAGDRATTNFEDNKALVGAVLIGMVSKKMRNRVAGYLTTLVKQLEAKRQEEEAAAQASQGHEGSEKSENV